MVSKVTVLGIGEAQGHRGQTTPQGDVRHLLSHSAGWRWSPRPELTVRAMDSHGVGLRTQPPCSQQMSSLRSPASK